MSKQNKASKQTKPSASVTANVLQMRSRPFTPEVQAQATTEQPTLEDIKTQRESQSRLGHNFADIVLGAPTSPPPPSNPFSVQAKLTIGQSNDKYEQEADRVAQDVVQRMHSSPMLGNPKPAEQANSPKLQCQEVEEVEELQAKLEPGIVQRESIEDEDELQLKPDRVQLKANHLVQRSIVQADFESTLNQARGSGSPLDTTFRAKVEPQMGADFGGVKIHTDATANQLSQSIQAKAFTTGNDIFFKQGEYNPGSRSGQELIAHELTHVVQQSGSNISSINRSLIQAQGRQRSNAITGKAPDLSQVKVAKLHMHADLDAPDMKLIKQLTSGEVGHAWVGLEWNDPSAIPDDLPNAHKNQLRTGEDPFGFWPRKFEWHDYTNMTREQIAEQIQIDNSSKYSDLKAYLKSPEFRAEFKQQEGYDLTDQIIEDQIVEVITQDTDMASLWGGFHGEAADAVGYSPNPFNSYVPGQVLHPDYMHAAKATQTYELTRAEVNNVLNYAEAKKNSDYSVFFYNCTTFAKEAVEVAGKTPPSSGTAGICYPDKLYQSIKKNFEKGKGTTSLEVNDTMVRRVGIELANRQKGK